MKFKSALRSTFAAITLLANLPAHALLINATFGTGYTSQDQVAINTAISYFKSTLTNNVTVNIDFSSMSSGLGSSSQYLYGINYANLHNALYASATSANDLSAANSLSNGSFDPSTGATNIGITHADCAALGLNCGAAIGGYDGSIGINLGLTDPTRSDGISAGYYDLVSVASHEIDEILGIGGPGSLLGRGFPSNIIGILDLFRYTSVGTRTYTTSGDNAYFSINGGTTDVARFNNDGFGDYGDWHTSLTPQVQDAYGTPGVQVNMGTAELTALDVIGWTLASNIPEPSTYLLLFAALPGLWFNRRQSPKPS